MTFMIESDEETTGIECAGWCQIVVKEVRGKTEIEVAYEDTDNALVTFRFSETQVSQLMDHLMRNLA